MEGKHRNYPHGAGGGVRQARAIRRGMMMVWNMPTQAMIAPMIFAFSPDTKLNFWSMVRKPNIRINTPLRRKRLRAKKRCFAAASRALCSSVTDRNSVVWGKSVEVRVDHGGRRTMKKNRNDARMKIKVRS